MSLQPAFPYDAHRVLADNIEDADAAVLRACVSFLHEVHGDGFATTDEVATMHGDISHARDVLYNSSYVDEINAFFAGRHFGTKPRTRPAQTTETKGRLYFVLTRLRVDALQELRNEWNARDMSSDELGREAWNALNDAAQRIAITGPNILRDEREHEDALREGMEAAQMCKVCDVPTGQGNCIACEAQRETEYDAAPTRTHAAHKNLKLSGIPHEVINED